MATLTPLRLRKRDMTLVATIKVAGLRRFGMRAKCCAALLRLAAWVSPVPIEVDLARGNPEGDATGPHPGAEIA